jgi:hypothetical protein
VASIPDLSPPSNKPDAKIEQILSRLFVVSLQQFTLVSRQKNAIHHVVIELSYFIPILCASCMASDSLQRGIGLIALEATVGSLFPGKANAQKA